MEKKLINELNDFYIKYKPLENYNNEKKKIFNEIMRDMKEYNVWAKLRYAKEINN